MKVISRNPVGLVGPVLLVNCVPDLGGCLPEPGALPDAPDCVVDCVPGPAELPLEDNGVLSETRRKFSDNSSDPEGWNVLYDPR